MAVFSVPRYDRQSADYMEKLISSLWNTRYPLIFQKGYGVFSNSTDAVVEGFRMVQSAQQRYLRIRVHHMELRIEAWKAQEEVIQVADKMGRYFCQLGFQAFAMAVKYPNGYLVEIIVNAVSYVDGRAFHDNNRNYREVLRYLRSIAPYDWKITVADNVFFQSGADAGNYEKGVLLYERKAGSDL